MPAACAVGMERTPWARSRHGAKDCSRPAAGTRPRVRSRRQRCFGWHSRYDVKCCWQPINSQRMLLWARRFGKAERFMDALGRKHFTEAKSASHDWTILDAAEEAGLDPAEAEAFLNSDELSEDVWQSYGTTVREKGIHAIPYFVFNSPQSNAGKFRRGHGQALVVNGSASETEFLSIFEGILADLDRVAAAL
mmetsp:Transcript_3684/g.7419  ORF Transcript_3684/g.7419 Transcript_3684/m.7419 type:complete len:193 (+) Transcript_3684:374-952(+)